MSSGMVQTKQTQLFYFIQDNYSKLETIYISCLSGEIFCLKFTYLVSKGIRKYVPFLEVGGPTLPAYPPHIAAN